MNGVLGVQRHSSRTNQIPIKELHVYELFRCELKNYLNIRLTLKSALTKKAKTLNETDKDFGLIDHFKLYINFEKDVRYVQPFQVTLSTLNPNFLNICVRNKIISKFLLR